jgi:hypothetical protein
MSNPEVRFAAGFYFDLRCSAFGVQYSLKPCLVDAASPVEYASAAVGLALSAGHGLPHLSDGPHSVKKGFGGGRFI